MYYAWKRVKVPNNNGLLTKYLNKYSVKMAEWIILLSEIFINNTKSATILHVWVSGPWVLVALVAGAPQLSTHLTLREYASNNFHAYVTFIINLKSTNLLPLSRSSLKLVSVVETLMRSCARGFYFTMVPIEVNISVETL